MYYIQQPNYLGTKKTTLSIIYETKIYTSNNKVMFLNHRLQYKSDKMKQIF